MPRLRKTLGSICNIMRKQLDVSEPVSIDFWEERERLEQIAANQLFRGHLLICIGAGVSRFANLPGWWDLLSGILSSSGLSQTRQDEIRNESNPYTFASLILNEAFGGERDSFEQALRANLYDDTAILTKADAFSDPGMQALSFLCTRSIRGGSNAIVTFNYDDIVERMFSHSGTVCRSVTRPQYLNARTDVDIFHPHGYLPQLVGLDDATKCVLCKEDLETEDMENWTRVVRSLLATHFPIFVGLSGFDDILLSHLEAARAQNPMITKYGWPYTGIALGFSPVNHEGFRQAGIKVIEFSEPDEWPNFVSRVCQMAADLI